MSAYRRDPWRSRSDRWTTWQAEQAGTNTEPSVLQAFLALLVVTLLAVALLGGPHAMATQRGQVGGFEAPSCVELARLDRVHAPHDRTYRATSLACSRSRQAPSTP